MVFTAYFGWGVVRSLYLESTLIKVAIPSRDGTMGTVRIAQVSDLHRAVYGERNQDLVDLVASKAPDIIVATGDMIDVRAEGIEDTVNLFRRFVQIAPVFYSLGNHERDRQDLTELLFALHAEGVSIVHNDSIAVEANGVRFRIGGVYQAEFLYELERKEPVDILLCHFPEKLGIFAESGVPLTFSGHTHGGQFRLPLADKALYAPGQGWFPEYTTGLYEQDGSYMIVSRGLGNSSFPFRVHNPPEVIIADVVFTSDLPLAE